MLKNESNSIAIFSLNYDTLLFQALELNDISFNIPTISLDDKKEFQITVCLPHGCSNIYCESGPMPDGILWSRKSSLEIIPYAGGLVSYSNSCRYLKDEKSLNLILNEGSPYFPILCHIIPEKFSMYGQNFIDEQFNQWYKLLKIATHVLIVGVRYSSIVQERDRKLWDSLKKTSAKILYVSGKRGEDFDQAFKLQSSNRTFSYHNHWEEVFDHTLEFLLS